ncbi:MAG: LamG domain-containing protein, partial [Proteobacteria bacterium]
MVLSHVAATNRSELHSSWTPHYSDLVAYWTFNGVNGLSADSVFFPSEVGPLVGEGHSPTLFFGDGKLFESLSFSGGDGSGDQFVVPDHPDLQFQGDLTVATWVNPLDFLCGAGNTTQRIMQKYNSASESLTLAINGNCDPNMGALGFRLVRGGVSTNIASNKTLDVGQWNHVAATLDGNTIRLYVNGIDSGTMVIPSPYNTFASTALRIGHRGNGNELNGAIDDFAIWNVALTEGEIRSLFSRQSALYSGSLVSRTFGAPGNSRAWSALSWLSSLPTAKRLPDANCGVLSTCTHNENESSAHYTRLVGQSGSTHDHNLSENLIGLWHLDASSASAGLANDFLDTSGQSNDGEGGATVVYVADSLFGRAVEFPGDSSGHIVLERT